MQGVEFNRIGWLALRHKDGWWAGTEEGVTCYGDPELARVALTVAWQRDGGRSLNFRIQTFQGDAVKAGDYTPRFSAEEALSRYEIAPDCRV